MHSTSLCALWCADNLKKKNHNFWSLLSLTKDWCLHFLTIKGLTYRFPIILNLKTNQTRWFLHCNFAVSACCSSTSYCRKTTNSAAVRQPKQLNHSMRVTFCIWLVKVTESGSCNVKDKSGTVPMLWCLRSPAPVDSLYFTGWHYTPWESSMIEDSKDDVAALAFLGLYISFFACCQADSYSEGKVLSTPNTTESSM